MNGVAQGNQPTGPGRAKFIYGLVGTIGAIFAAIVLYKVWSIDFQTVANADYARGLITVTIILAFVILGIVLILAALFGTMGDATESEARFRRAREVYTSVVGIVGTIVGFYFGSSTTTEPLHVTKKIDGKSLVVKVSGGTRPYNISVVSKSKNQAFVSEDGLLTIDACTLIDPTDSDNRLEVLDSRHASQQLDLGKILADKTLCSPPPKDIPAVEKKAEVAKPTGQ